MTEPVSPIWSHGIAFCPNCMNELDQEDLAFGDCSVCGGEEEEDVNDAAWDPSLVEE